MNPFYLSNWKIKYMFKVIIVNISDCVWPLKVNAQECAHLKARATTGLRLSLWKRPLVWPQARLLNILMGDLALAENWNYYTLKNCILSIRFQVDLSKTRRDINLSVYCLHKLHTIEFNFYELTAINNTINGYFWSQ